MVRMKNNAAVFLIFISMMVMCLAVPVISAAIPDGNRQTIPLNTNHELNLTAIANHTLPSPNAVTPTPIHIEVRVSDTLLPAPKGEMAAGPRTIGFSFDPVSLVIVIVAIVAGAAGMRYVMKRKPDEKDEDE